MLAVDVLARGAGVALRFRTWRARGDMSTCAAGGCSDGRLAALPRGERLRFDRRWARSRFLCLRLSIRRGTAGPRDAWTLGGGWTRGLPARTPACAGVDVRAPPLSCRPCGWPGAGFLPPPARRTWPVYCSGPFFLHRFSGFCGKILGCWRLARAGEVEEGGLFVDAPLAVTPEAPINTKAHVWGPLLGLAHFLYLLSAPGGGVGKVAGCTSLLLSKPFWFKFFRD